MTTQKKALGRGLDALFSVPEPPPDDASSGGVLDIDINKIEPTRAQPRRNFDDDKLRELAESIQTVGVIQPIIVKRETDGGESYTIVAGERRWRAARMAGLKTIPAIERGYDETAALETALIENIQRADLNPVEEAECYRRLLERHGVTQETLAEKVGKSRAHISNLTRLLTLKKEVLSFVEDGTLSLGHAKTLLPLVDEDAQLKLANEMITNNLNVRQAETLVKKYSEEAQKKSTPKTPAKKTPELLSIERDLNAALGAKVKISQKSGQNRGKIEIEYNNPRELEELRGRFLAVYESR